MALVPINSHVLIEPLKHESFMAHQKQTYQEIGVVVAVDLLTFNLDIGPDDFVGKKVLFDAWLAKKYPKEGTDEYYWLVRLQDIVAYER